MSIPSLPLNGTAALAASTAASTAASATGADPTVRSFGLSMRFAVSFDSGEGSVTLGEWSACKGLKVDFKTEPVKRGGEYDYEVNLPTQVVYGQVTLERAMEKASSQKLQAWLGNLVATWVDQADSGYTAPTGTVSITLQDVHLKEVATWHLRNAYPVSWSGPVLDAKGSTVALETLTLEHQGFLPTSAVPGV